MNRKRFYAGKAGRLVFLAVVFALAWTLTPLADDLFKFVQGTKVNGVLVGGLTVEEAKVRIEGFYSTEYTLKIKEKGGVAELLRVSEIGYQMAVTDGLQAILEEQNASGRLPGSEADKSRKLEGGVSYEEGKLAEMLNNLSCVSGSSVVKTQSARISGWRQDTPFTIIPEVQGNSVNVQKLTETVKAALNAALTEIDLESAGCYESVTLTSENEALQAKCALLNQIREMTVTYVFGSRSEVLGSTQICAWITGTDGNALSIDRGHVAAYVKCLADLYDTAGKVRVFPAFGGREVPLNSAYGWTIDQARETDALIALIQSGQSQTREPLYLRTAANRDNDWGSTYIEVDLNAQHVYLYQDAAVVWDAPCVTGNVSKRYTTPEGIYLLKSKETNRILRGKKLPDGTYEYQNHVDYWMPFNGGIGLHDANWRRSFGGTIYRTAGSHGCINLPPEKARSLYSLVYTGIPVICHN